VLWYGLFVLRSIWWVPFRDDRELNWTFWQSIPGNSHLILGMIAFAVLAITSRTLPKPSTPATARRA
jgi:alpha-1,2-mannosyltransferase